MLANFNQITPENSMKPEGWYDGNHEFAMSDNTRSLLKSPATTTSGSTATFWCGTPRRPTGSSKRTNGVRTPITPPVSPAARWPTRPRCRSVSVSTSRRRKAISDEFGPFGSDTNPVVAFDVVNETVNDTDNPDTNGMRNSLWYQTYDGEDYIYDAFENANTYFNEVYADLRTIIR